MGNGECGMGNEEGRQERDCLHSPCPIHHSPFPIREKTRRCDNMRDGQRIAIVDPSDSTREELRNVLLGMESVWLEAECSRYEFFYDVIQQSQPDVVIVSLDSDQQKALALIQNLHSSVPDMP